MIVYLIFFIPSYRQDTKKKNFKITIHNNEYNNSKWFLQEILRKDLSFNTRLSIELLFMTY